VTTAECKLDGAAEANALRMAPDTDEGFAAALLEVASNTRYATELGGRAQDWVRQTLDWEALAAKADESYSAAAARSSRG
jgi:glycosyltransferase involved in cell wall biosynthesis